MYKTTASPSIAESYPTYTCEWNMEWKCKCKLWEMGIPNTIGIRASYLVHLMAGTKQKITIWVGILGLGLLEGISYIGKWRRENEGPLCSDSVRAFIRKSEPATTCGCCVVVRLGVYRYVYELFLIWFEIEILELWSRVCVMYLSGKLLGCQYLST